jgi:hypothetical protein
MLSKKERKNKFRAVGQERLEKYQVFHILSCLDMPLNEWIVALKKESKPFNVNLDFKIKDSKVIQILSPGLPNDISCALSIGCDVTELAPSFQGYDCNLSTGSLNKLTEMNCVSLYGQRELNPIINLIFNSSTRILGRITKGILVDVEEKYMSDDWETWSYDYYGNDNFKAFDYDYLATAHPGLIKKKWWKLF